MIRKLRINDRDNLILYASPTGLHLYPDYNSRLFEKD